MAIKQVGFDDLLAKTDQTSKKKTSNRSGISKKKITFSQEDMDKLCEIYDWYMLVKDLDVLKEVKLKDTTTSISIEKDILKTSKRVSVNIDKDVWDDFSALCSKDRKSVV